MSKIWILSADGSRANLFATDSPSAPFIELVTFDNPDAREKFRGRDSDRPGRCFDSHGEGRHAMEPKTTPEVLVETRFAKLIADRLEQGRINNEFERLVVVAAPAFLGHLRANFSAPLSALVTLEIDKNYTGLRPDELRARLTERL